MFLPQTLRRAADDRMQPLRDLDPPELRPHPQNQRAGCVHLPAVPGGGAERSPPSHRIKGGGDPKEPPQVEKGKDLRGGGVRKRKEGGGSGSLWGSLKGGGWGGLQRGSVKRGGPGGGDGKEPPAVST